MCDISCYFSLPTSKIKQPKPKRLEAHIPNPQLQEIINYDELQVYHRSFYIRPHSFLWPQAVGLLAIFDMTSLFKDDFKSRFSHVTKTWPICRFQPDNHRKVHVNLVNPEAQSMDIFVWITRKQRSSLFTEITRYTNNYVLGASGFLMWKKVHQRIQPAQGKAKMRD